MTLLLLLTGAEQGVVVVYVPSPYLARPPHITFYGEAPPEGTAVSVEYTDSAMVWDDNSAILWDDSTPILWSHFTDVSPDRFFSFNPPRITYSGEAE